MKSKGRWRQSCVRSGVRRGRDIAPSRAIATDNARIGKVQFMELATITFLERLVIATTTVENHAIIPYELMMIISISILYIPPFQKNKNCVIFLCGCEGISIW
uniref:Uncharacterized protein n=1 Tax=Cucumis melo TaxID=3656 RepID=A0A9I9DGB9_CUCME